MQKILFLCFLGHSWCLKHLTYQHCTALWLHVSTTNSIIQYLKKVRGNTLQIQGWIGPFYPKTTHESWATRLTSCTPTVRDEFQWANLETVHICNPGLWWFHFCVLELVPEWVTQNHPNSLLNMINFDQKKTHETRADFFLTLGHKHTYETSINRWSLGPFEGEHR